MFDLSTKPKVTTTTSKKSKTSTTAFEKPPLIWAVAGYISYMFLFAVSWMRELLFGMGPLRGDVNKFRERPSREGYAPLYASFESFYTRKTTYASILSNGTQSHRETYWVLVYKSVA